MGALIGLVPPGADDKTAPYLLLDGSSLWSHKVKKKVRGKRQEIAEI